MDGQLEGRGCRSTRVNLPKRELKSTLRRNVRGAQAARLLVSAGRRNEFLLLQDRHERHGQTFNGLELSESVLSPDWSCPEEDVAWADL